MTGTLAAMAVRRCQSARIGTVDNPDHKPCQESTHIRLDGSIKGQVRTALLKSGRFPGLHHAHSWPATGRQAKANIDIVGPRVHVAPIDHLPVTRRNVLAWHLTRKHAPPTRSGRSCGRHMRPRPAVP